MVSVVKFGVILMSPIHVVTGIAVLAPLFGLIGRWLYLRFLDVAHGFGRPLLRSTK
jgi:hypothetical protein